MPAFAKAFNSNRLQMGGFESRDQKVPHCPALLLASHVIQTDLALDPS